MMIAMGGREEGGRGEGTGGVFMMSMIHAVINTQ
jgi:hypothetical protein